MELKVIFEDEEIVVLDKPAGITVNRADTTKEEVTVQDWIEKRFKINDLRLKNEETDFYKRAGIVHRLDKETSGVLIVAKTPEAFQDLQRQFKERIIEKTYIALAHGRVVPKIGEIHVPVGRLAWNRKRFGIVADGRQSSTKYKVLSIMYFVSDKKAEPLSLVELYPRTGRTHQIRVHLKYLNYPIVSDLLYGGRKQARKDRKILPRMFLHAKTVSFTQPKTGSRLTLSSDLPDDLQSFLNLCKSSD